MRKNGDFDVIIAGGGPAGLSAFQWCLDLGLTTLLIEKQAEFGGQLLDIFNPITNYLGVKAANGRELRDIFLNQLSDAGVHCITGAEIVDADFGRMTITTADGIIYGSRAVIVATGVRRRELGIPGEREFRGRGVMRSASKERNEVAGKRVAIVGGGDAALENALMLAEKAASIVVVHRRDGFTARPEFWERARQSSEIEFVTNTIATAIMGKQQVEAVEVENVETAQRRVIDADAVLLRVGFVPNTELFRGQLEMDEAGYIIIDRNCAASRNMVFAIGDATNRDAPTIIAAAGQASIATKSIRIELLSKRPGRR
jgi:thioredoxin reductase (NADPH)